MNVPKVRCAAMEALTPKRRKVSVKRSISGSGITRYPRRSAKVFLGRASVHSACEAGFAALRLHQGREGHCVAPFGYNEGDHSLGQLFSVQRRNKNTLTAEGLQRLDEIGFVWDPRKLESN